MDSDDDICTPPDILELATKLPSSRMEDVDPQMFTTCRLCLQQTGSYQIVPLIQHQIKYCFDINVEPFDLLPQLLCKECKQILSDYFATKQRFVELQKKFKRHHYLLEVKVSEDENETNSQQVSSSQTNVDDNDSDFNRNLLVLSQKKSCLSSASSDDCVQHRSASPAEEQVRKKKRSESTSRPRKDWEEFYRKHYICTICNKEFKKKYNLLDHFKLHNDIFEKHKAIFTRHCTVTLHKLDDKPNLTGMPNSIAFDENRIQMENVRSKYCVVFKQKQPLCSGDYDGDRPSSTVSECSDDGVVVRARNRKKCRLESASSNDTTVLNMQVDQDDAYDDDETRSNSGEKNKDDVQCINIDDSSNAGSATSAPSKLSKTTSNVLNEADYKVIQSVVNLARIRYLKKNETENKAISKSHIKQKILNMGRKVLTKKGINCTDLLRFMEHQNLNIQWIQKSPTDNSCEKDIIYIKMKLKDKQIDKKLQCIDVEDFKSIQLPSKNDVETESMLRNILLNENPVANPKKSLEVNVSGNDNSALFADTDSFVVSEMCLPKIESTTSFAVRETTEEINMSTNIVTEAVSNAMETLVVPRIKVKPVSELMSENAARNDSQEAQVYCHSNISPWATTPSYPVPQNNSVTAIHNIASKHFPSTSPLLSETPMPVQMPSQSSQSANEYLILVTPDLTNITTSKPYILYLKGG